MAAVNASTSSVGDGGVVVGPQFCSPYLIELVMKKKVFIFDTDRFEVTDVNKNLLFRVVSEHFSLHHKMIVLDAAGNPVLTLRCKVWSFHSTWEAFRGESSDPKDLVFTVKTSFGFQFTRKLKVYLAYNTTQELCDFKLKGSYLERSCVVYAGESNSAIVAQMEKKFTAGSLFLGKDELMVTVYPSVDQAFIVALMVVLDAIDSSARRKRHHHNQHHHQQHHQHHQHHHHM